MKPSWLSAETTAPINWRQGQRVGLDIRRNLDVAGMCAVHQQTGVEKIKRRDDGE